MYISYVISYRNSNIIAPSNSNIVIVSSLAGICLPLLGVGRAFDIANIVQYCRLNCKKCISDATNVYPSRNESLIAVSYVTTILICNLPSIRPKAKVLFCPTIQIRYLLFIFVRYTVIVIWPRRFSKEM